MSKYDEMTRRAQAEWERAERAEAEVRMLSDELERLGAYKPIRLADIIKNKAAKTDGSHS